MSTRQQWALAFARQAQCDLDTRDALAGLPAVAECQRLHFLQMACEKLCKAHLYEIGSAQPGDLESSHCYVAKHLPDVLKNQYERGHCKKRGKQANRMKDFRALAREIQCLAPACDEDGRRPDNCEYPWESGGGVNTPADYPFPGLSLLKAPSGSEMLKLIRLATDLKVQELATE